MTDNPLSVLMMQEREKLKAAQEEINKTVESFDRVVLYLAHQENQQRGIGRPRKDEVPAAERQIEAPKAAKRAAKQMAKLPAGFWAKAIQEALASGGAMVSGDIWTAIQATHNLPDKGRSAFYQGLSQARRKRIVVERNYKYSLAQQPKPKPKVALMGCRATIGTDHGRQFQRRAITSGSRKDLYKLLSELLMRMELLGTYDD